MIQRLGIYLGAFIALAVMLAVAVVISPGLMVLNWIEDRKTGRKYTPTCGCVRCAQMRDSPPDAAGSAALARPASSTPSRP